MNKPRKHRKMDEVAKISLDIADQLKREEDGIDIVIDGNNNYVIDVEEAREILAQTEYEIINWVEPYIGAPRPRKRPK